MVEAEELDIFSVEKDGEDRALAMSEKMGRMDQLEQEIEAFEEDTGVKDELTLLYGLSD